MLAKIHSFWLAMLKSDHRVFPVTNMVAPSDVEDDVPEIVAVEVEPERVDHAAAFIDYNQDSWSVTATAYLSGSRFAGK